MLRLARTTALSFLSLAIFAPPLPAQDAQDPKAAPAPQKLDKQQKRKLKKSLKELDTPYKQWLNEDVVYIIAPEERQSFLQLETYDRPMEEGGGSTSTYPWETWRYRYMEGIGENVIWEFVDPTGSGEYRLTMDPSEKDALLHVPGAGLSLLESMGMASKTDRFTRSDGTNLPRSMGGEPASMNEFTRLEQYSKA